MSINQTVYPTLYLLGGIERVDVTIKMFHDNKDMESMLLERMGYNSIIII